MSIDTGSSKETRAIQAPGAFSNPTSTLGSASAPEAIVVRPHWRINANGQPERAIANGPWQQVLPNLKGRMRVLSASGDEVWVAGEKSQVFRSLDNGTRWINVPIPEKNGRDHTVAHIRFGPPGEIMIEAADGTKWTTSDGGNSWE